MNEPSPTNAGPAAQLLTMKIIAGSLIVGVTMLLLIALLVFRSGKPLADAPWALTDPLVLVGAVVALSMIPVSVFLPDQFARPAAAQVVAQKPTIPADPAWQEWGSHARELLPIFQTRMIIRAALLEGAAFLNGIVYMLSGSGIALALAVALILVMAWNFPTGDRVRNWLETARLDGTTL